MVDVGVHAELAADDFAQEDGLGVLGVAGNEGATVAVRVFPVEIQMHPWLAARYFLELGPLPPFLLLGAQLDTLIANILLQFADGRVRLPKRGCIWGVLEAFKLLPQPRRHCLDLLVLKVRQLFQCGLLLELPPPLARLRRLHEGLGHLRSAFQLKYVARRHHVRLYLRQRKGLSTINR